MCLTAITVILLLLVPTLSAKKVSQWEWQGVDRVVAIGDIHGLYDYLELLLKGTELIDEDLTWIGGTDHLVLCGDILDRGKQERKIMDLLMRLQEEAKAAGGQAHVLLGNHDVMNLVRDLRFVHKTNYADFVEDEKPKDRKKGLGSYKQAFARKSITESQLKAAFEDSYPPGYFGRLRAFEPKGKYGSWFQKNPTIIKINDIVFLHGGLTEEVAEMGLDKINRKVQENIKNVIKYSRVLEPYIKGIAGFGEFHGAAVGINEQGSYGQIPASLSDAARGFLKEVEGLAFDPEGPLWYRGNSLENESLESLTVERALKHLRAEAMVIAHTPTGLREITSRFSGRVFRSDVGMVYDGNPFALVISEDKLVYNNINSENKSPFMEDPRGEERSDILEQLPDKQMEEILLEAKVIKKNEIKGRQGRTFSLAELEHNHRHYLAIFQKVAEKPSEDPVLQEAPFRHHKHEVASYLLDRKLGLRFVPVTVIRTINGQSGSLQQWMDTAVNLVTIKSGGYKYTLDELPEEYLDQVTQVRIFWALIDMREGAEGGRMLLPEEKRIMAADNTKAFSLSHDIRENLLHPEKWWPAKYASLPRFRLNPAFDLALRLLEFDELKTLLGKHLTDDQIKALLKRRDRLLKLCSPENRKKENPAP